MISLNENARLSGPSSVFPLCYLTFTITNDKIEQTHKAPMARFTSILLRCSPILFHPQTKNIINPYSFHRVAIRNRGNPLS